VHGHKSTQQTLEYAETNRHLQSKLCMLHLMPTANQYLAVMNAARMFSKLMSIGWGFVSKIEILWHSHHSRAILEHNPPSLSTLAHTLNGSALVSVPPIARQHIVLSRIREVSGTPPAKNANLIFRPPSMQQSPCLQYAWSYLINWKSRILYCKWKTRFHAVNVA